MPPRNCSIVLDTEGQGTDVETGGEGRGRSVHVDSVDDELSFTDPVPLAAEPLVTGPALLSGAGHRCLCKAMQDVWLCPHKENGGVCVCVRARAPSCRRGVTRSLMFKAASCLCSAWGPREAVSSGDSLWKLLMEGGAAH